MQGSGGLGGRYLDRQLFENECKLKRPSWGSARVEQTWQQIKATTPVAQQRSDGPSECPTCLPMPGWIFGENAKDNVTSNYHDKAMSTSTKRKVMTEEDIGEAVGDCALNLSILVADASKATMDAPRSSITFVEGDRTGETHIFSISMSQLTEHGWLGTACTVVGVVPTTAQAIPNQPQRMS